MPLDTYNLMQLRTSRRSRRGQTAVIALLVLLLLAFVGALFITIIARNLRSQGRSHRTLSADYYAEAGLRFADDQLTHSLDGADWRPPLQNALATTPALDARGLARYNALVTNGTLAPANRQDPDYPYLSQGFARYNTENGRFLLRVTYDPIGPSSQSTSDNPSARYLKIESIGREGVVVPDDPTTFTNQPPTQLAATLVAYKPIGITDYARFETNIDNRNDTANLGVPSTLLGGNIVTPGVFDFNTSGNGAPLQQYPLVTVYGQPDAYMVSSSNSTGQIFLNPRAGTGSYGSSGYVANVPPGYSAVPGGGSIRANMPLRLYGQNYAFLNTDAQTNIRDGIEIAGSLLLNDYQANGTLATTPAAANTNLSTNEPSALILNPNVVVSTGNPSSQYVAPSNGVDTTQAPNTGTAFSTYGGAVRDGGAGTNASDADGNPRSIARLDPPVIDAVSRATQLTRYQDITENSPSRANTTTLAPGTTSFTDPSGVNDSTRNPAPGLNGWGRAIYVGNTSDVQRDSSSLVGGHTLVDEWLNRNSGGQNSTTAKSGWQGPFYNPPGVDITFGLQRTNGASAPFYGVRLTRSDVDASGKPVLWTNADGSPGTSPTLIASYADLNASNDPGMDPATLTGTALAAYRANPNNDVVIYAEGNIRVRPSVISLDPATAPSNSPGADTYPRHVTLITNGTAYIEGSILKGNPDSSVTILARDYVCLNTTQFYSGAIADENAQSAEMPRASVTDSTLLDFAADSDVLVQDFDFNPNAYPSSTVSPVALYVSGGPSAAGVAAAQYDIIDPVTGKSISPPNAAPFVAPTSASTFSTLTGVTGGSTAGAGVTGLTHITFNLSNAGLTNAPLQLWTRRAPGQDQSVGGSPNVGVATQDYVQERSAILPGDIKIQAVLYAQDKSFFVIPGPWFNTDTGDNLSAFSQQTSAPLTRPGIDVTNPSSGRFPFYGQPVDLRITINGAVSEARPADISAQAAWMQKWGWIPSNHGSNLGLSATPPQELAGTGHTAKDPNGKVIPGTGLTLVYDPQAGYPYNANTANANAGAYYLRSDLFGRPLPFTPKLPVSTGLLYAGQGDPQSVLQ